MAEKPLIIKDFDLGIGPSPHKGFGDMRNLDVFSLPGIARLNFKTVKRSGSVVTNIIKWFDRPATQPDDTYALDASGVLYVADSNDGAAWAVVKGNDFTVTIASPAVFSLTAHGFVAGDTLKFTTTGALPTGLTVGVTYYVIAAGLTANAFEVSTSAGGTAVNTSGSQSGVHSVLITTGAVGQGMKIWNDYVIIARATQIDTYGPLSSSPSWTFNWKTDLDTDNFWHPMLISKNDFKLYIGAGRYIASLEELTTFVPATAATFTWIPRALDLPENYRVKCLAELGNNLEIGTWWTQTGSDFLYNFKIATIFPWDRTSSSFGEPLTLEECGINQMININEFLYFQAGIDGKYFKSNGVTYIQIAQIPASVVDLTSNARSLANYPGAIMELNGKLVFGISSDPDRAANLPGMGVWSINLKSKNSLTYEQLISTGSDGTSSVVKIGALLGLPRINNSNFLIGWADASTYGIDRLDPTDRYTTYLGYIDSPFYNVGTPLVKKQFSQMEFQLVSPLATGQGLKFWYRTNILGSFTQINPAVTYDFATLGAVASHSFVPDIPNCEFVQIRVQLTTDSSTTLSPELKNVVLR